MKNSANLAAANAAHLIVVELIYALAFLPIHDKPNFPVRSLIVTLAINLATVQLLLWYFGPKQKNLPKIFGTGKLDLGPLSARYDQIGAIAATVVILGLVLLWLKVSRKGLEIRLPDGLAGQAAVALKLRGRGLA